MLTSCNFYWFRIDNKHMTEPRLDQELMESAYKCACAVLLQINWDQPVQMSCLSVPISYIIYLTTLRLEHTASNSLENNNNLQLLRRKTKTLNTVRNQLDLLVQLLAYDFNYVYIYQTICNNVSCKDCFMC